MNLKYFFSNYYKQSNKREDNKNGYGKFIEDMILKEGDGASGHMNLTHESFNPYSVDWKVRDGVVYYKDRKKILRLLT